MRENRKSEKAERYKSDPSKEWKEGSGKVGCKSPRLLLSNTSSSVAMMFK